MLLHLLIVVVLGQWFYTVQIFGNPNVQPLGNGHLAGRFISACVEFSHSGSQLLGNDLFGFIGNAALDLLACSGIETGSRTSFIIGISLSVDLSRDLAD